VKLFAASSAYGSERRQMAEPAKPRLPSGFGPILGGFPTERASALVAFAAALSGLSQRSRKYQSVDRQRRGDVRMTTARCSHSVHTTVYFCFRCALELAKMQALGAFVMAMDRSNDVV
jgi:hypothetical protein